MPRYGYQLLTVLSLAVLATPARAQTASPSDVVAKFFKAASDSNLKEMGTVWGTAKGPAASVKVPVDWEKRLLIVETLLTGVKVRTLGELDAKNPEHRTVTTELSRGTCRVTLAVSTVMTPLGWVVNEFDLSRAAEVNKVCDSGTLSGNKGGG